MDHYNTTNESGSQLFLFKRRAQSQQEIILNFFRANRGRKYQPADLHDKIEELTSSPITSIRRAITNLTEAGYLEKTEEKIESPYGRPSHLWTYKQG